MSQPLHVIATITPAPGKSARVAELLTELAKNVLDKEPKTLRYHMHRAIGGEKGSEDIVMIETYESQNDMKAHGQTPHFKDFGRTLQKEGLVAGPPKIVRCLSVAGFESRDGGLISKL